MKQAAKNKITQCQQKIKAQKVNRKINLTSSVTECNRINMQEKEKKTFANMFDKFAMADRKKEALEKQVFESISNMENPSQTNCSNGKNLQMKPDAMNHIDQWSSGGEGSINTDPNSIKVSVILFMEGILSNAHGCFQGWG